LAPCVDDKVKRWRLGDCEIRYERDRQVLRILFGGNLLAEFSEGDLLIQGNERIQKGQFKLE
jgi:hypothetical protein